MTGIPEEAIKAAMAKVPDTRREVVAILEAAAPFFRRETASQFYRNVRQIAEDFTDHKRDIIAMIPFAATLDQIAVETYGLTEEDM